MKADLTVLAIPGFIAAMGAEWWWQRRHPAPDGAARAGDYEFKDTMASLTMGVGSLLAPYAAKRLLDPVTPGRGRWGKALVGTALAAGVATTVLDVLRQRADGTLSAPGVRPDAAPVAGASARAERVSGALAATTVAATVVAASTAWAARTSGERLFASNRLDLGSGAAATAAAILGWDAIYYWNHRLSHESRWLWAMHVVHHSSERYNLSTALRQPVAEHVVMTVPYGLLSLVGVRPAVIEQARALNLLYQFWIHTEVVRSIGWLENILNTPSHHRVHHGSNEQYLDKNHGSILIIWDRLFGTFERERETVRYGLTTNIDTFNPARIAAHEFRDILDDVATATTWRDRWSFLLKGPGWAYPRRAARLGLA